MEKKARFETFKLHINLVIAIGFAQIWFVVGSFLVDVELVNIDFELFPPTTLTLICDVISRSGRVEGKKWLFDVHTVIVKKIPLLVVTLKQLGELNHVVQTDSPFPPFASRWHVVSCPSLLITS